jgi:beta-galactosidase
MTAFTHNALQIGAQVMDDPAATPEKIDQWFATLRAHDMPLARVFIPRTEEGLRRMDQFFRAAEKYGVKIAATLDGWRSEATAAWIRQAVERYRHSAALDSWILVNEPGQGPDANPLAVESFRGWLKEKYGSVAGLNRAWATAYADFPEVAYQANWSGGPFFSPAAPFLDWLTFWRAHLAVELQWIADHVRQADAAHPTHVNPHALIGNLAAGSLDLPAWRGCLDSYGASCHPSWHFSLLARDEYTQGVSYVSDLVREAAGGKPFWITELQGGGNTNSGGRPISPTAADIAQWLWTAFGAGAERVIFWLLNNRSFGVESGEWSLLDFQNQPSERLQAAARVARVLREQEAFLRAARPVAAPVTILLSLETMTLHERFERTQPLNSTERGQSTRLEARGRNAHVLSVLANYRSLTAMGVPVQVAHIHSFDWQGTGRVLLVPNLAALSAPQAEQIRRFVEQGNTALITGLTGAWDPENRFWPVADRFPLENLVGATLKEIGTYVGGGQVTLREPKLTLPADLWVGEIANRTADVIGMDGGHITAVRRKAGAGAVIWIPATIDLGAWFTDDTALASLLRVIAKPAIEALPFRFRDSRRDCVLRVLQSQDSYLTVIANGSDEPRQLFLIHPAGCQAQVLWNESGSLDPDGNVRLAPRGTVVVAWKAKEEEPCLTG